MKKLICLITSVGMLAATATGCGNNEKTKSGDTSSKVEDITLTVAGPWDDCAAVENASVAFSKKYPNCHIEYEYIQNFDENLPKRLAGDEDKIDLYLTNNIQKGSELLDYSLEFSSLGDTLDLSHTYEGLITNFKLQSADEADKDKFYSIPLGAEIRGMYVNKTLLDSLDIAVPQNKDELFAACQTLVDNGYIPLQGNPGIFSQELLYPYVCNLIANSDNYEETYKKVDSREDGISEMFREPMEFMYTAVEKGYYNYKYVENNLGLCLDISNEGSALDFFNIIADEDGNYSKKDDVGQIAFMPLYRSIGSAMEKTKDDYHSKIEYEFILCPVSDEGGYAYMSPGRAIAVNKNSDYLDESVEFINFIFEEKENITFCDDLGLVPNTENAFDIVTEEYDVPKSNISQLGQVTFSYDFYDVIFQSLLEISKANNPKYMNTDENGNSVMYPFSYYMDNFENRFHTDE